MSIKDDMVRVEHADSSVRAAGLRNLAFRLSIVRRNIGRASGAALEYGEFVRYVTPVAVAIVSALGREPLMNRVLAVQVLGGLPSKAVFSVVVSALTDPDGLLGRVAYVALFRLSADVCAFKAHRLIRRAYKSAARSGSDFVSLLEKCGGTFSLAKWPRWQLGLSDKKAAGYFEAGEKLRSRGQLQTAAQRYRWSLFRWPYDRAAWLSLGETSIAMGEHTEGIEQLQFGCQLSPFEPQPVLRLAEALRQVGDTKTARNECETVLKLDVGNETRKEAERILDSC